MSSIRNPKDFFSGLLLLCVSLFFAYGLIELPIGTAFRMGPGYFPLVLTALLAALSLGIMANGFRGEGEPIGVIPWRALVVITVSIVLYGVTLRGLGLVPALALTVLVSTFAGDKWSAVRAIALTAILVVSCTLVFVNGLGLPLSLFGPWVGGY